MKIRSNLLNGYAINNSEQVSWHAPGQIATQSTGHLNAPMPGTVVAKLIKSGTTVEQGTDY